MKKLLEIERNLDHQLQNSKYSKDLELKNIDDLNDVSMKFDEIMEMLERYPKGISTPLGDDFGQILRKFKLLEQDFSKVTDKSSLEGIFQEAEVELVI